MLSWFRVFTAKMKEHHQNKNGSPLSVRSEGCHCFFIITISGKQTNSGSSRLCQDIAPKSDERSGTSPSQSLFVETQKALSSLQPIQRAAGRHGRASVKCTDDQMWRSNMLA